jgi:hypothetical protein
MKMSDTAGCECGATRETITHLIYEYPLLQEDRQVTIDIIGHRWRDLDGPKEKWRAELPAVKAVLHFLCKTGRFTWQTKEAE